MGGAEVQIQAFLTSAILSTCERITG